MFSTVLSSYYPSGMNRHLLPASPSPTHDSPSANQGTSRRRKKYRSRDYAVGSVHPACSSSERAPSGNILPEPESQSNAAGRSLARSLAEKNNASGSAISPLSCPYRDHDGTHRFRPGEKVPGVPGSCQPRGRKVHEPLSLVVDDRVVELGGHTTWQGGGGERTRREQAGSKRTKNKNKKEGPEKKRKA